MCRFLKSSLNIVNSLSHCVLIGSMWVVSIILFGGVFWVLGLGVVRGASSERRKELRDTHQTARRQNIKHASPFTPHNAYAHAPSLNAPRVEFWPSLTENQNSEHLSRYSSYDNKTKILDFEINYFSIFFDGTDFVAFFQAMEKRFFATDRKINNLELRQDGFFDFDPYPEIFRNFEIKHLIFRFGPKKWIWYLRVNTVDS